MTRLSVAAILSSLLLAAACFGGGGPEGLESNIGDCQAGTTLQAGEGCSIAHTDANDTFWVNEDGSGCYHVQEGGFFSSTITECVDDSLSFDDSVIVEAILRNEAITAAQNDDGSWTVESVP